MAEGVLSLSLFILLSLLTQSCHSLTCFAFNGTAVDQSQMCPGSQACCDESATCLPNRLCHNKGDPIGTYVRGSCAVAPYNPNTCSQLCLYNETTGFLPQVNLCDDGSFCCDDDPQCCGNHRGTYLDASGQVLALPSGSLLTQSVSGGQLSSTLTLTSTSVLSSMAVSSGTASPTYQSAPLSTLDKGSKLISVSPDMPRGTKIAVGLGISLGVLLLGTLAIVAWFHRQRLKTAAANAKRNRHPRPEVTPYLHPSNRKRSVGQPCSMMMEEMDERSSTNLMPRSAEVVKLHDRHELLW